ncbi:MAG: hypothetical protein Q9184_006589 [Pyrenodesmia sp. 2 TL-2023]
MPASQVAGLHAIRLGRSSKTILDIPFQSRVQKALPRTGEHEFIRVLEKARQGRAEDAEIHRIQDPHLSSWRPKENRPDREEVAYTKAAQDYLVELNALQTQVTICDKQEGNPTCISNEAGNRLRQPALQFWTYCSEFGIETRFRKIMKWRKLKLKKMLLARSLAQKQGLWLKFQCHITKQWARRS